MSKPVLTCPRCRSEWHITGDGKVLCHSCGHEVDSYSGAAAFIEQTACIKKPGNVNVKARLPIYECPSCKDMALVNQNECGGIEGPQFFCFSCGGQWSVHELERCPECNQWRPGEEFEELIICRSSVGFYVCGDCYSKIFK